MENVAQMQLTKVWHCSARLCRFNGPDRKCHAPAISVGGELPRCNTYIEGATSLHSDDIAEVGSCWKVSCIFNESLDCTAKGMHVKATAQGPVCRTFQKGVPV